MQKFDNIYSIDSVNKEKIYLFQGSYVDYSLCTDGTVELLDVWVSKRPYEFDNFLEDSTNLKRYEFRISDANVLLLEKKHKNKIVRNLYVDKDNLYKIINTSVFHVSINKRERLIIKKLEKIL